MCSAASNLGFYFYFIFLNENAAVPATEWHKRLLVVAHMHHQCVVYPRIYMHVGMSHVCAVRKRGHNRMLSMERKPAHSYACTHMQAMNK